MRFLIAIIAFLGYGVQYIQRINMSVAIVCMVNNTEIKRQIAVSRGIDLSFNSLEANSSIALVTEAHQCMFKEQANQKAFDGPYAWNKKIQGLILSAYFYGYITTQIAGGFLSIKFGAKIVLAIAILIGSLLTMLSPVASGISPWVLFACRFFTGVAHGAFWPAMSSLWAHWAPPTERSRLVGIANAGSQIGNVAALSLGGLLCVKGPFGGWPSIFYFFGGFGLIWFVLWIALTSKSPRDHRFISEREREYILDSTKDGISSSGAQPKTPWLEILKSKSFWGLVLAHSTSNFGTYLFLTQLPTYMKEVLKFDIKSNGALSSLPYIAFWFFIVASSVIGDKLYQSGRLSKTAVRKIFNTLGLIVPMGAVIALSFVTCAQPYVGVALLTLGLAFTGCGYGAGFMVNYNDIAGSFAGLVFGMSNTPGTVSGIVAPSFVGILTQNQLQSEWRLVFIITAVVYLVGAIGYLILGSGELEEWAKKKPSRQDAEESIPLK